MLSLRHGDVNLLYRNFIRGTKTHKTACVLNKIETNKVKKDKTNVVYKFR